MRGSEKGSSQQGLGAAPQWEVWGHAAPEADDIFSKWCINTSSTEVLDNICSKKHFKTFPGASAPLLAHACGRPWLNVMKMASPKLEFYNVVCNGQCDWCGIENLHFAGFCNSSKTVAVPQNNFISQNKLDSGVTTILKKRNSVTVCLETLLTMCAGDNCFKSIRQVALLV